MKTVFAALIVLVSVLNLQGQQDSVKLRLANLARQQFDKGISLVEDAQSADDFRLAVNEFNNALTNALYGGIYNELKHSVYYNLGIVYGQLEDYDKALHNLTMYISALPAPEDSAEVALMIKDLEKKSAEFVNPQSLTGVWYYSVPKESSEPRLEIKYESGMVEVRMLPSEATGNMIPPGEFIRADWNIWEKKLTINDAPYYTCDKSVDTGWCPHKVNITLIRTGENKLQGELSDTGVVYQDLNNPQTFTSSGNVVFERGE